MSEFLIVARTPSRSLRRKRTRHLYERRKVARSVRLIAEYTLPFGARNQG